MNAILSRTKSDRLHTSHNPHRAFSLFLAQVRYNVIGTESVVEQSIEGGAVMNTRLRDKNVLVLGGLGFIGSIWP